MRPARRDDLFRAGPENPMSFDTLGLSDKVVSAVKAVGYTTPTPIQATGDPARSGAPRRARPRPDRHRQDGRLRAADADAARTRPRPRAHAAHADPRADARAREPGAGQFWALRRQPQAQPRASDRRRLLRRAGQDHHPRRRRADRDARPAARPFRARTAAPDRRRDPRHRRGRPHARHGLHPRHRADREAPSLHPADALLLRHDAAGDHASSSTSSCTIRCASRSRSPASTLRDDRRSGWSPPAPSRTRSARRCGA